MPTNERGEHTYPHQNFKQFTEALASTIELREDALTPESETEMNSFEGSIDKWINATKLTPDSEKVTGMIGPYLLKINNQTPEDPLDSSFPVSLEDRKDPQSLLTSLAISRAKLLAVRDTMEHVYPLLTQDADKYLNYLDSVKDEIIQKNTNASISFKEILGVNAGQGKLNLRLTGASVLILSTLLLAGCGPAQTIVSPEATPTQPQATETAPLVETPTLEPFQTPTETPVQIPTETPTETPLVFTGFESVIKDPAELQKVIETNMTQEEIIGNIQEFLTLDENTYRQWVTQYSFYHFNNESQLSPIDTKGKPLNSNETVKRLGLFNISTYKGSGGSMHLLAMQGLVLGTQYVYNEDRGEVQSYVYLGIEDGTGKRGVIGVLFGDADYEMGYTHTSKTDSGLRSGASSSETGSVTSVLNAMAQMRERVGDAILVDIPVPVSPISINSRMESSGIYAVGLLNGVAGENAAKLESEIIASYKEFIPMPILDLSIDPPMTKSSSATLDDKYFVIFNFSFSSATAPVTLIGNSD